MNEASYIKSPEVQKFADWLCNKIDVPGMFYHKYESGRSKELWSCDSLFSAYKKYIWKKASFEETEEKLSAFRKDLSRAIKECDNESCMSTCTKILSWGGVNNKWNNKRLRNLYSLGDGLSDQLQIRRRNLNSNNDLDWYGNLKYDATSGFSKIYSLLADNFVIYDSRVSSALCAFIRDFYSENHNEISEKLKFSYFVGRAERNPSQGCYKFGRIASEKQYLKNNINANWLLREIVRKSTKFNVLGLTKGLRALEAALFMVGYKLWLCPTP
ncbi:MAG: hypothetical protein LBR85_04570 [Oscillospiraceae bacterium]|jgi:hypothetical protein|nr:hypothetical protein [Oscillospiraceae bacterium]